MLLNDKDRSTHCELARREKSATWMKEHTFVLLYKSMVRPHVEFGDSVRCLFIMGDIEDIEMIQKRATKLLISLKNKPYKQRLMHLKLPTLKFRHMPGNIIRADLTGGGPGAQLTWGH